MAQKQLLKLELVFNCPRLSDARAGDAGLLQVWLAASSSSRGICEGV